MGFKSFLPRNHRFLGRKPKVSRQETFAYKPEMAKRHMLYGWSDIVMARNRSVRYPSSFVPSGLLCGGGAGAMPCKFVLRPPSFATREKDSSAAALPHITFFSQGDKKTSVFLCTLLTYLYLCRRKNHYSFKSMTK
jgi:hypothetical protein